jgi:hypothetical protein
MLPDMNVFFVTGKCCAGKDHYISKRWPTGLILNIGEKLRIMDGNKFDDTVMNSPTPSCPTRFDHMAYELVRGFIEHNLSKHVGACVINGFPRHAHQYHQVWSLSMVYRIEVHVIVIESPKETRLERAQASVENKKVQMRTTRIISGEKEFDDMLLNHKDENLLPLRFVDGTSEIRQETKDAKAQDNQGNTATDRPPQ